MNQKTKLTSMCLALAVAAAFTATSYSSHAQSATATISGVAVSGGFDYTILLDNTGSTSLEGFWYAWTDSGNNLAAAASSPGNTLGWGNSVFGSTSIQWQGTSGNALAPGGTGDFTFFSTGTPAAITTSPSGESVVYVTEIGFNDNTPGTSSPIFSPTLVPAPEPASAALMGVGVLGLLATGWRKIKKQS